VRLVTPTTGIEVGSCATPTGSSRRSRVRPATVGLGTLPHLAAMADFRFAPGPERIEREYRRTGVRVGARSEEGTRRHHLDRSRRREAVKAAVKRTVILATPTTEKQRARWQIIAPFAHVGRWPYAYYSECSTTRRRNLLGGR